MASDKQKGSGVAFLVVLGLGALMAFGLMMGDGLRKPHWHATDVTGSFPRLSFTATRAEDGKTVTAKDYRGKIVLIYFGYTFCPDICPNTLENMASVLDKLGKEADRVRFLFVTVDPDRDTPDVLKKYAAVFAPQVVGLRMTPDRLTALTRRYRIAYSVTKESKGHPYTVSHSSAVYIFDDKGHARLLVTDLDKGENIGDVASDLKRLLGGGEEPDFLQKLMSAI
ncbi:MAG: redoxin domain-containing protein [Alphaproteobacteria bacterium]|nr:redoxin domain-containing protein [Alphaproteobacteria bacterium]